MNESTNLLLNLLDNAEMQYKYALALNAYYSIHDKRLPKMMYWDVFTWGENTLYKRDISLPKANERNAVVFLSHSSLYILVTQIDTILEHLYGRNRFRKNNINDISCVARLIRNAFTHKPFHPKWLISREFRNKEYNIDSINIKLKTNQLANKPVKRSDYGGPTAVLKLATLVRKLIMNNHANVRIKEEYARTYT